MQLRTLPTGQLMAVVAAASFGLSGAFIKPLLEAGWSPAAAVTLRALIGGLVLAPFAAMKMRGRWSAFWPARWRLLGMGLVGVAGTQVVYFAAVQRIPIGTAILIEYMAPLLLVAVAWAVTKKMPKAVVLIGSVVAFAGLVMIVSPSGSNRMDLIGLGFAVAAMVGCAAYYVISARPSNGLPAVALASIGLLIGAAALGLAGLVGIVPFSATTADVTLFGDSISWWIPMLIVGVLATAVAYAASITASELIGSRLASFLGLLEVAFAAGYAWLLLGQSLSALQLLGGALILAGIGFVRSDKGADPLSGQIPDESGPALVPAADPDRAAAPVRRLNDAHVDSRGGRSFAAPQSGD